MKLGDNMTTDACNMWGDICPRKCRPPRIGDIPKHGAVDQESPGSSSNKLTISPKGETEDTLEIPLETSTSLNTFQSVTKYLPEKTVRSRVHESNVQNLYYAQQEGQALVGKTILMKPESIIANRSQSPPRYRKEGVLAKESIDQTSQITIKLSPTSSTDDSSKFNLRTASLETSESVKIPSSPEETSDTEILEVRKDSALFLEEAEGLPTLREILKSRAPRFIRPRRESSGYASNLGTFDEDRRNSSTPDVLQDLSSFLKERRRSSTKRPNSRAVSGKPEDNFEEIDICNTDRMPTSDIHRKISSAGLEMPNIEEVKEIMKDESSSFQESIDNLCNLVEDVDIGDQSAGLNSRFRFLVESAKSDTTTYDSSRDLRPRMSDVHHEAKSTSETIHHAIPRDSSTTQTSTSRKIIHQCSTPILLSDKASETISCTNRVPPNYIEKLHHVVEQSKDSALTDVSLPLQLTPTLTRDQTKPNVVKQEQSQASTSGTALEVSSRLFPRPVKVYQLLSTQSEDRGDGEPRVLHRRTSLQIPRQEDEALSIPAADSVDRSSIDPTRTPTDKIDVVGFQDRRINELGADIPVRKLSSPGEVGVTPSFIGDAGAVTVRPIYPYCPYSPYGSPQGSPRNRRRPLRESRRVSIDNRQGALQLNQYKLLDNIGQGSYGIVKLAYNEEDETHYAMKILSKKKLMKKAGIFGRMAPGRKNAANPLAKVYREIALLKKLDHPNVVKLVEVLDDPDEDNLYLVFELVQRGEVLQIPTDKPLDEETARKNFRDVVIGVEYLHYQRIVHRDIKPSNLLVDSEGRVKIADLGVSAELRASGELLSGPAGTPAFAAPETTTPGAHYSGTLCDVWSMGITLYSLVTGRVPWDGAGSIIGVQVAVRSEPLKFPEKPSLSEDLRDVISRMLAKDPAERITLQQLKEHPWLTDHGKEPLPCEEDNCRLPVTVTDEEVERVVTRVPKLDTLILIKTMLKQHSFQNPFLPKRVGRNVSNDTEPGSPGSTIVGQKETFGKRDVVRNFKSERFQKSGRSNSAPDSYDWHTNGRQISVESPLPPVTEASSQESDTEKR